MQGVKKCAVSIVALALGIGTAELAKRGVSLWAQHMENRQMEQLERYKSDLDEYQSLIMENPQKYKGTCAAKDVAKRWRYLGNSLFGYANQLGETLENEPKRAAIYRTAQDAYQSAKQAQEALPCRVLDFRK